MLLSSKYNFSIPFKDGQLLFSALSGAMISLQGDDADELTKILMDGGENQINIDGMPKDLLVDLFYGEFITSNRAEQFNQIRRRFRDARVDTPMVLTVTTTLDCNLGCYYCYQDRSSAQLESADVKTLVLETKRRLLLSQKKSLHVDWYGGEPLQNQAFIEESSFALQSMCREISVAYRASIISNGTLWPKDVQSFISRHVINQVQISFDGIGATHDKIRRLIKRKPEIEVESSFSLAVELIDQLSKCVRVDARFNINKKNINQAINFIRMAEGRGWFSTSFPVVIQPARVSDYSERSSFMKSHKLTLAEFDTVRAKIRAIAHGNFSVEESEVPNGYPFPRTSVCAALAHDSYVLGADRKIFRCGLQVSEPHRAVGEIENTQPISPAIAKTLSRVIPISSRTEDHKLQEIQTAWWQEFDPCDQPTCSKCSFLPICMGGCPKKHLENDRQSLDEQGTYWRTNLPRLLAAAAHPSGRSDYEIPYELQFR